MKALVPVLILATLMTGCAAGAPTAMQQRAALGARAMAAKAEAKVVLKSLGEKGNGYTTAYELTVTTPATTVALTFDDTPMNDDEGGPYRTELRGLTVDGKKVGLNDVKEVEAAAKVLAIAPAKVDEKHRKAVQTAVRALTWDL